MKDKKRFKTIRFQLSLYYSIFIFILLVVATGVVFFLVSRQERENIETYGASLLQQTSESIDSEMEKYEIGLNIVNNNALLQRFAAENHTEDEGKRVVSLRRDTAIFNVLMDISYTIGDINSIGIFVDEGADGYFIGNASTIEITDDYLEFIQSEIGKLANSHGETIWTGPAEFQQKSVILAIRNIIDNQNLESMGTIVFNIEKSRLEQILRKTELGKGKAVFITDSENQLIGASDQELYEIWEKEELPGENGRAMEGVYGGKTYLIVSCESESTGWTITGLIPMNALKEQLFITQVVMILIAIVGIFLSIVIAVFIARHLARPMERLRNTMQEVAQQGKMNVVYEDDTFYETQELGNTFVKMIHDIDDLVIKNRESELKEKEAQLSALQAQINPHFLYNTLNTINYMLILENKPEISRLVVNLGDLLRSSIEEARGMITLEEELTLVEKYLYIQKARFGDQLDYQIQVTEEARQCLIIRLLIQPLAENSIIHGFVDNKGTVYIFGEIDQKTGNLILIVEDNGRGMSEETVKQLLVEKKSENKGRRHIGVANVNKRIHLYYGEEYGIQVTSKVGEGTKIQVEIPVKGGNSYEDEDSDC